jgi:glucosylceramidase
MAVVFRFPAMAGVRALSPETIVRRFPLRTALAAALTIGTLAAITPSATASAGGHATTVSQRQLALEVTGNIEAAHSGRCLDVTGGITATGNGVPIQQYDCLGSTATNQIWTFQNEIDTGGYVFYNIVATHSGKCLDVTGGTGATGNGVPIQQYTCLGSAQTNQQWRIVTTKLGQQIIARHSGLCLDVTGGTGATGNGVPIQQYDCLGILATNQLWYRF